MIKRSCVPFWGASICFCLALLSISSGCLPAPAVRQIIDPGTTNLRVQSIEFRGVENVSERDLRDGLALREDPGWRSRVERIPILGAPPAFYNQFHWRRDRERILTFYRQRGYFDAEIVSESIIEDPQEGTVRIRVTISEGEPTLVTKVEIQGLTGTLSPSEESLLEGLPLQPGEVFAQRDYLTTRDALGNRLRLAGHAYAVINGRAYIDPSTHEAEVIFYADPGPRTRMGPAFIFGLEKVREKQVRAAIPFEQGDPFSPDLLSRTQTELYDLGVFGLVTVLPAHEARDFALEDQQEQQELRDLLQEYEVPQTQDPSQAPGAQTRLPAEESPGSLGISEFLANAQRRAEARTRLDPEVPIVIHLQEAKQYNIRVGAGLAAESTRQDARALLTLSARNFLGGLRQLSLDNAAGYAWAEDFLDPQNRGVILSSTLTFDQPQFIDPLTTLRLRAAVTRDVELGFSSWNPSFRLSVARPIWRRLVISLAYNLAYFNYFNVVEGLLDPTSTALGLDFEEEFLLEYLEQTIALDLRDDILDPRRGFYLGLTVQEAGRFVFGGEFSFIKPILSGEVYIPVELFTPSVIALRSRLGAVYSLGDDSDPPVQNRLYSGGTDGMRSFGRRRLSLYTATREAVPIGGLTQFEASVEPRFRLIRDLLGIGDLWGALFVDAATVLGQQFLFNTGANRHGVADVGDIATSLLYGTGAGIWWNTPVGPVRLDFAYTLSNIQEDPRFRRCVDPSTYGTPQCQFVPVEEDLIQDLILGYGFYISIGHSF